jgi:hypothetical protein
VTEADPQVNCRRFGGEGEGGHTDLPLDWKTGETFRYIVTKKPGKQPDSTDCRYYIFDRATGKWRHLATITNANDGKKSVTTIGGGLNSFLENYLGKDQEFPRLATYRIWLGTSPESMKFLTKSGGDGMWGELNKSYFLAAGDKEKLKAVFAGISKSYGEPAFAEKGKPLPPLPDQPLPQDVISVLKNPPAPHVL